jgi:hypothetical protein
VEARVYSEFILYQKNYGKVRFLILIPKTNKIILIPKTEKLIKDG